MDGPTPVLLAHGPVTARTLDAGRHYYRVWYWEDKTGNRNDISQFSEDYRAVDDEEGGRFDCLIVDGITPLSTWMAAEVPYLYLGTSPRCALRETVLRESRFRHASNFDYILDSDLDNRSLAGMQLNRSLDVIDLEREEVRDRFRLPATLVTCDETDYPKSRQWAALARKMAYDHDCLVDGFVWLSRMGFRQEDPPDEAVITYREVDRSTLNVVVHWEIRLDVEAGFDVLEDYLCEKHIVIWPEVLPLP